MFCIQSRCQFSGLFALCLLSGLPALGEAQIRRAGHPGNAFIQPYHSIQTPAPRNAVIAPAGTQRYARGGFGYWPGWDDASIVQAAPLQVLPAPAEWIDPGLDTAQVSLQVPLGAKVWVQGQRYDPFVGRRVFQSPPLPPGANFLFEIRVSWMENGKLVEQTDRLDLLAGQRKGLLYIGPPEPSASKKEPAKRIRGGES